MLVKAAGVDYILPFYHAISDERLPHIANLYRVKTIAEFEQDLDWLLQHFEAIDLQTFVQQQHGGKRSSRPTFLLSFDDGLREVYDVIAPILVRKGVPAVFFINSGFVGNRGLFFRYKASLLAEAGYRAGPGIPDVMDIRYHQRHLLDEAAAGIGLDFEEFLRKQQPYMGLAQLQELAQQGFTIGAHSVDHPEYQYLPVSAQIEQSKRSLDYVADHIQQQVRVFSFPFTDYGVGNELFRVLHQELGATSFGCAGIKEDASAANHQRVALEVGSLSAKQIISSELVYALMRKTIGKNIVTHGA